MRSHGGLVPAVLMVSLFLGTASLEVSAQSTKEEEIKKLQDELALQKVKNELFAATYPKFEGGKTGAVEGADKLLGMAYQHLPRATSIVGRSIAVALAEQEGCSNGTVVISGQAISEKMATAISFAKQIEILEKEVSDARPRGPGRSGTATIIAAAGALISYAGMFKTDYKISNAEMKVDTDWLISSIVMGRADFESERFPSRSSVDLYITKLDFLKENAQGIPNKNKKKKDILKRIEDLRSAMLKPDASGILPIVTTALLSPVAATSAEPSIRKCLAFISGTNASPLLLTKDNLFSKGGKAFLYLPVQASVIQMSSDGVPLQMICKLATVSAPIKLSALTKAKGAPVPWSSKEAGIPVEDDCGTISEIAPLPGVESGSG